MNHHAFNLQDVALRLCVGAFSRGEKARATERSRALADNSKGGKEDEDSLRSSAPFFEGRGMAAFAGTLGGSVVVATGMSPESYAVLRDVEEEMGVHAEVAGPALGAQHKKFRATYGKAAKGTVDGDLLGMFEGLRDDVKKEIAGNVGRDGEAGALYIEALIRELFDRVA